MLALIKRVIPIFGMVKRLTINTKNAVDHVEDNNKSANQKFELELLKEKLKKTIATLKNAKLQSHAKGTNAWYALPWYMVIGPSAVGKSTLLKNSGLNFPMNAEGQSLIKKLSQTRNCDWWLSDRAILLDTAGRYTTETDDHGEWLSFLNLLKQKRKRLPLNGIIVAMSVTEIMAKDSEKCLWHIKIIRNRIHELYQTLGFRVPVYLIITKIDLLMGFNAFFSDLNQTERNIAVGIFLGNHIAEESVVEISEKYMETIVSNLRNQSIHKLNLVRARSIKQQIFMFPEQFQLLIIALQDWIKVLTTKNPYVQTPFLAGIYFTSSVQEGEPFNQVLDNMNQTLGGESHQIETRIETTKPFFIQSLFDEVILRTQDRIELSPRKAKNAKVMRNAAWAILASSIILQIALGCHGYVRGKEAVNIALAELTTSSKILQDDGESMVNRITAIKELFAVYQDMQKKLQHATWLSNYNLDPTSDITQHYQTFLNTYLQGLFYKPLLEALANDLKSRTLMSMNASANDHEHLQQLYQILREYLMLRFPTRMDVASVQFDLCQRWHQSYATHHPQTFTCDTRDNAVLGFYLSELQRGELNKTGWIPMHHEIDMVKNARNLMHSLSADEKYYQHLKSSLVSRYGFTNLQQMLTANDNGIFYSHYQVPKLFTAWGWQKLLIPILDKTAILAVQSDWVLLTPLSKLNKSEAPLAESIQKLDHQQRLLAEKYKESFIRHYFRDYQWYWIALLQSLQIRSFSSMNTYSSERLLTTNLNDVLLAMRQLLQKNLMFDNFIHTYPVLESSNLQALFLEKNFIHNVTTQNAFDHYLKSVDALQNTLEMFGAGDPQQIRERQEVANVLQGKAANSVLNQAATSVDALFHSVVDPHLRLALEHVFKLPMEAAWKHMLDQITSTIKQSWQTELIQVYRAELQNNFPFSRYGKAASMSAVAEFFRPQQGHYARYVSERIKPFLFHDAMGYHPLQWLNLGLNFSPQFLQSLSKVEEFSKTLFDPQTRQIHLRYAIFPYPTSAIAKVTWIDDNNYFHYENGPQVWHRFNWPKTQGGNITAIMALDSQLKPILARQFNSEWGLFYLVRDATLVSTSNNSVLLNWTVIGKSQETIRLELKSEPYNIFKLLFIDGLQLPNSPFVN